MKLLRAEVANIPERNFLFETRKDIAVKYILGTLMNGRVKKDDSEQFDPGHQNPCIIIKILFTRSPITGK
jgi:hypothetical protein